MRANESNQNDDRSAVNTDLLAVETAASETLKSSNHTCLNEASGIQNALQYADKLIMELEHSEYNASCELSLCNTRLQLLIDELRHTQEALETHYSLSTELKRKLLDHHEKLASASELQRSLELQLEARGQEFTLLNDQYQQLMLQFQHEKAMAEASAKLHNLLLKKQFHQSLLMTRLVTAISGTADSIRSKKYSSLRRLLNLLLPQH